MTFGWMRPRAVIAAFALAGTALVALPAPAVAQDSDARLRKIEAEIRALQRQVFPNGDGRFFTPEVVAPPANPQPVGTPSSSAVTDMLGRLDALEAQLAQLTAMTEVNANALNEVEERLAALEARPVAPVVTQPTGVIRIPEAQGEGAAQPLPVVPVPEPAAGPSPERLAAVQAIAKPSTGDAGDDEYVYGFRLWEAGYYPEAQQQLKLFVERYPDHWRTTYGRNLLGRAYLDGGKPREAAPYFLENYQSDGQSARAPDSLLYLAEAMIAIEDTNRACIALAEFGDTYPALATGRLRQQYESDRAKVTCN